MQNANSKPRLTKKKRAKKPKKTIVQKKTVVVNKFGHPTDPSINKMIQTLFFPQKGGIHRGTARGLETTAITWWKSSVDLVTDPSLPYTTFTWKVSRVYSSDWFTSKNALAVGSSLTTPTVAVAGPFLSPDPSFSSRVVSARIRITPQSAVIDQGGTLLLAYVPDAIIGSNTPSTAITTKNGLDQMEYNSVFSGTDRVVCNWVPDETESRLQTAIELTSSSAVSSAVAGYIVTDATVLRYRVDFEVGIEYVPTVTYRPFVDRKPPDVISTAPFYVNQVVSKHWRELLINTWDGYLSASTLWTNVSAGHLVQYAHSSAMGAPSASDTSGVYKGSEPVMGYCDVIEDTLGYDVCGGITNTAKQVAKGLLKRTMGEALNPRMVAY